jgi:hypothetical protein
MLSMPYYSGFPQLWCWQAYLPNHTAVQPSLLRANSLSAPFVFEVTRLASLSMLLVISVTANNLANALKNLLSFFQRRTCASKMTVLGPPAQGRPSWHFVLACSRADCLSSKLSAGERCVICHYQKELSAHQDITSKVQKDQMSITWQLAEAHRASS